MVRQGNRKIPRQTKSTVKRIIVNNGMYMIFTWCHLEWQLWWESWESSDILQLAAGTIWGLNSSTILKKGDSSTTSRDGSLSRPSLGEAELELMILYQSHTAMSDSGRQHVWHGMWRNSVIILNQCLFVKRYQNGLPVGSTPIWSKLR